jgi:putative membrane protein
MTFELFEWMATLMVAPELGDAYLGTQGDQWDAQKDMALATLGSILVMIGVAMSRARAAANAGTSGRG